MRKVKPKQDEYAVGPSLKNKKSEPRYPTVRLDLDTIPEAKDWKIGKSYRIEMEVKMTGISQSRFDNSAEFEIRAIEADDDAGEETEED
jgi:hypothetical protein